MNATTPKIARIIHALELAHAATLRREAMKMARWRTDRIRFLHEARNCVREAERVRLFASLQTWRVA